VKADDSLACWGLNSDGQTTLPVGLGAVKSVSAGFFHTCAVKADDSLACWGYNFYGQTTLPVGLGAVKSVSAGAYHTCAVKADDSLACWGLNSDGQTTLPVGLGAVKSVSAGFFHTCAVKADDSLACWGYNDSGQTDVPAVCEAALAAHGCWRFDEPSGTTAVDDSPFVNNGTYLGNPTLGVPGVLATALSLNSVNDWVRVADSNSLDVGDSFSLEGWIKRTSTTVSQTMFNKGNNGYQLTVMSASSGDQVYLRKANVSTIARSSVGVPADNGYHHIVATKNASAVKIYVDGTESTVPVSTAQVVQNTTYSLLLGPGSAQPVAFDQFAIYDQVLSPADVSARFLAGTA